MNFVFLWHPYTFLAAERGNMQLYITDCSEEMYFTSLHRFEQKITNDVPI